MQWITRFLIGLCFGCMAFAVTAQDSSHPVVEFISSGVNDPRVNPEANACYYGGTLSGKCNTTEVNGDKVVDSYDRDWMWQAGWHLIRYEYNVFRREEFEPTYLPILETEMVRRINTDGGCYGVNVYGDLVDVYLSWKGGLSPQDSKLYDNDQCTGNPVFLIENVIAIETFEQAQAICEEQFGEAFYARRFERSLFECYLPKYPPG